MRKCSFFIAFGIRPVFLSRNVTRRRVMRTTIAAGIIVSRPCGENLRRDMRRAGGLWVIIRTRIITGSAYNLSTIFIRSPIHRMTGTAIELPNARYRGPSAAGFFRYSTSV